MHIISFVVLIFIFSQLFTNLRDNIIAKYYVIRAVVGVALRRETRVRCGLMFCDIMAFIVTTVLPDMDHVTALSSGTCAVCCVVDFV